MTRRTMLRYPLQSGALASSPLPCRGAYATENPIHCVKLLEPLELVGGPLSD